METLENFLENRLIRGRYTFTREAAEKALNRSSKAILSAADRLKRKRKLVSPRRGFYLILRPEDRALGAPPPERWIASFMAHLQLDYRVSLLRAAAFHGASHQAAMLFQVIAPRQLKPITVGRQRVQFLYQKPEVFAKTNRGEWLSQLKSDTGYAKIAGIELTLLDTARYFHKAAGINGIAQLSRDLGAKADARKLAAAARAYENASVRRLGYLLDRFDHRAAADALLPFARQAKSVKPLDPAARSLSTFDRKILVDPLAAKWKLVINVPVEIDT